MSPVDEDQEDLTRRERREQARAQRKAVEEAEVASAARKRRLGQLGIVAAVVIVAIVVILIATGGGGSSTPKTTGKASEEAVSQVNADIGGIPQNGNTIGNPNAPVTIQYFGDLECPVCKEFTLGALPTIMQQWVKTGKVKIEYKSLETATREPEVFKTQQVAALAAGKQNLMWNYVELFYHQQGEEGSGYVTEAYLHGLAKQIHALNQAKWMSARNETALGKQVEDEGQAAASVGFNGTPAFLIGKSGGAMEKLEHYSLSDPTPFNEAIEKLLKEG